MLIQWVLGRALGTVPITTGPRVILMTISVACTLRSREEDPAIDPQVKGFALAPHHCARAPGTQSLIPPTVSRGTRGL